MNSSSATLNQFSGITVDREGLRNNYAVEPQLSYTSESSDTDKFRLGLFFAAATWIPVAIATLVS